MFPLSSASPTSPSVAGQPSPLTTQQPLKGKKRAANLWLPLSPFPSFELDSEDCDKTHYHTSTDVLCSGQLSGCWTSDESSGSRLQSIFEDWEDSPGQPNPRVIIEEDGTQILIMSPISPYFHPPPVPRPFDFAPYSERFADKVVDTPRTPFVYDDVPSSAETPMSPYVFHRPITGPRANETNKVLLYVDTSSMTLNKSIVLSASLFFSPETGDESAVSVRHGPDVPYSVTDTSPVEMFGEKLSHSFPLRPMFTASVV